MGVAHVQDYSVRASAFGERGSVALAVMRVVPVAQQGQECLRRCTER